MHGIFSTKEKAEAYCVEHGKMYGSYSGTDVEEFQLNEFAELVCRETWTVRVENDGSVGCRRRVVQNKEMAMPTARGKSQVHQNVNGEDVCFYGTSYESADHALKLAVEERQAWLRQQAVAVDAPKVDC